MRKALLLGLTTYRRQARSPSFIVLTLGLPLVTIAFVGLALAVEFGQRELTVGYVDGTGNLADVSGVERRNLHLVMRRYEDRDAAVAGYSRGEISGFLVIPAGYYEGERAVFYGNEQPNVALAYGLADFMRRAMLPDEPDWVYDRLEKPSNITYIDSRTGVSVGEGPPALVYFALPGILALLLGFALFTGVTQMGSAVVTEREQLLMETMLSSMSVREFLVGKVGGVAALTLTQTGVWIAGALLAIAGWLSRGPNGPGVPSLPPAPFVWALVLGLPCYFLYAMLAAGAGVAAGDGRQAQQLAGLLALACLAPLWMLPVILAQPDGATALVLTLVPLTGPMVSLLRMTLTNVPGWQLGASFVLVSGSVVMATICAAWLLRASLLMQGKPLLSRGGWSNVLLETRRGRSR